VIPWPSEVDEEYARVFRQNVSLPTEVWVPEAYAVFAYNRLSKVAVTGSAGEIGRPRYRRSRLGDDDRVTPQKLSERAKMGDNPLAIKAYRSWLSGVPKFRNPSVLELSRWEGSNWLAMAQLQFDIAWRDVFTPYNCRQLLTTMMSLDRGLRCGPEFLFFEALMRYLWADVLSEPFPQIREASFLSPSRVQRVLRVLRERIVDALAS
jgi:hypothetical protein